MKSMTGFGRGVAPLEGGRLVLEIRTVNHRFLEVRSRAPRELIGAEPQIEKLLRGRLARGHCTALLTFEGRGGGAQQLNRRALDAYLTQLAEVAAQSGVPLADLTPLLAGAPDLYALPPIGDEVELERAVTEAFDRAAATLLGMREAEGRSMAAEIERRLAAAGAIVERLTGLAEDQRGAVLARSRERLARLLAGTDIDVDPRRAEAEAALLADRADVTEELTRLTSHADQLTGLIGRDEPVGRRLEFLIQEMGREANTIGAKAAETSMTHLVVELKAELEKIREIVQNVE